MNVPGFLLLMQVLRGNSAADSTTMPFVSEWEEYLKKCAEIAAQPLPPAPNE